MYRYSFAVGNEAHCVWEYDLPARNRRFLDRLDPGYFEYLTERYVDDLNGPNAARAGTVLRIAYHHGCETLFSLLGALTQAPECVVGWLPKCSNSVLRSIVRSLQRGEGIITQRGRQFVSLESLSAVVHQYVWQAEEPRSATAARFATMWQRLADDFVDEVHISEYGSLKHGFRVGAGGFTLAIGPEPAFGVRAAPEAMTVIGSSVFGTSFYSEEAVPAKGLPKNKSVRMRSFSLNWNAEAMAQRVQLVGYSITNVLGALRCMNGAAPDTISFSRPEDPDAFDAAWRWSQGAASMNMDTVIEPDDVTTTTSAELVAELVARSPGEAT